MLWVGGELKVPLTPTSRPGHFVFWLWSCQRSHPVISCQRCRGVSGHSLTTSHSALDLWVCEVTGPHGGRDVAGESLGLDVICLRYRSAVHMLANEMIVLFQGTNCLPRRIPQNGACLCLSRNPSFWHKMLFIKGPVWEYGVAACPQAHPVFICLYFNWIILGSGNVSFE